MGLGAVALVTLAEARELALANRKLARSGGDPLADKRRAEGVPTFAEAARRVVEQKKGGWRGRWHAQNWLRSLERYAFPRIGERPVSEVNSADVLEILTPIWHVKAETAQAVRQRVRAVLEWAVAMELRADNPCDRVLPVLGPQNSIVQHRRALPHKDVATAIETVQASVSVKPAVKLAFEFLVLTAARSGEVRLATWDEIDTAGRVWTVPAMRMKAKREHRVPLCRRAAEILEAARTLGDAGGLVFPMRSGRPISMSTLPKMLQYVGVPAVAHGFRSSFRDWAAEETDHPREVIEAALAHVVQNKVEAAYARSDLFDRRRRLMDDWAAYLDGTRGERQSAAPSGEPDARGGNHHPPCDRDPGYWRDALPSDDRPVEIGRVAMHENGHGIFDGEHCRPVPPAPRGHAAAGQQESASRRVAARRPARVRAGEPSCKDA